MLHDVSILTRKLPKIQKIIDHYQGKVFDGKVVDLDSYRTAMALE